MSSTTGARRILSTPGSLFKPVTAIAGDGFELRVKNLFLYSEHDIPGYEFDVLVNNEHAGIYTVLIESDFDKIAQEGNVGLTISQKYFGKNLPVKIMLASYQLFESHGQSAVLITFDEDNRSIEKACEELAAQYLDTLASDASRASKKRYVVKAISHGAA